MTPDQLRTALKELNGERECTFAFSGMPEHESHLLVSRAILIPVEADQLVKVTDGKNVYIVDASRVAYIRIGLKAN